MNSTTRLLLSLLVFTCSCQPSPKAKPAASPKARVPGSHGFAVADSLRKYQSADSLLLVSDDTRALLHIGKAGAARYAICLVDSTLVFYQQQPNQSWYACDTLTYTADFSFARSMDLNADGIKDVRISTISGSAGNTENVVFLFDSRQARFRHNDYYDLPNVELDRQHQFIKSWWYSGVVHCQDKWKYQITRDSLTLDSETTYCPDEHIPVRRATLTVATYKNGRKVNTEEHAGKPDKLWRTFTHSLWDSSR